MFNNVGKIKDPVLNAPADPVTPQSTIKISCQDTNGECKEKTDENNGVKPFAVASNKDKKDKPISLITICQGENGVHQNSYFLEEDPWAGRDQMEATMNNLINSRGGGILHELMHLDYISGGGKHHIKDQLAPSSGVARLYGPKKIFKTARERGTQEILSLNADTYKMFAIEVYTQKKRGFRPYINNRDFLPKFTCASDQGETTAVQRDTVANEISGACSEFATRYSSDYIRNNAGNWYKELNVGKPGYMKFEVGWTKWARMSKNNAQMNCESRMKEIVDSCDTDTDQKKGGNNDYSEVMGLEYTMSMKDMSAPTLTCNSDNPDAKTAYARMDKITEHLDEACGDFTNQYFSNGNSQNDGYWAKTVNEGTPTAMEFSVGWKSTAGINHVDTVAICKKHMMEIVNNCDTDDSFKFGGHLDGLDLEGTEWRIKMLTDRPGLSLLPAAMCKVWWHPGYNSVIMRGSGFASSDYGQDKLLPELRECGGIVKDWKFDYDLDEYEGAQYEWKATTWTFVGPRWWGCVRQAMVQAGASSDLV